MRVHYARSLRTHAHYGRVPHAKHHDGYTSVTYAREKEKIKTAVKFWKIVIFKLKNFPPKKSEASEMRSNTILPIGFQKITENTH